MTYAETLSGKERKRGRLYAYGSSLTGCISEVMLDNSAVMIILFTMLQSGDTLTMLATSLTGVFGVFLYIPSGLIASRFGLKRTVFYSCLTGCCGFLLIAAAPFLGIGAAKYIAFAGCMLYCLQRSCYGAAWYPLVDVFLRPEDRGGFFGTMRFMYSGFCGVLLLAIGFILLLDPSIMVLQLAIAIAGIALLGRSWCISRFPDNRRDAPEKPDIKRALSISLKNGPLTSYSVYNCLLMLVYSSLAPVTFLYLKQYVNMKSGTVQIISAVGMGGLIFGYFCYSRFLKHIKLKYLELFVHLLITVEAFVLFTADKGMPFFAVIMGGVIFMNFFGFSLYMCNNSAELLALARPGNKIMAAAFIQTYSSAGAAISRLTVSLILGTSLLAPSWECAGREVSRYQTLFLFFGVLSLIFLVMLPVLPSFIPEHEDYYEPEK